MFTYFLSRSDFRLSASLGVLVSSSIESEEDDDNDSCRCRLDCRGSSSAGETLDFSGDNFFGVAVGGMFSASEKSPNKSCDMFF